VTNKGRNYTNKEGEPRKKLMTTTDRMNGSDSKCVLATHLAVKLSTAALDRLRTEMFTNMGTFKMTSRREGN
jgi:hypothetical protein